VKFCSVCGSSRIERRVPEGDTLPRDVCAQCGTIHYQNPKIVVGCLPEWESRILLCRRAIEPRYGLWTLPAGFLENGETLEAGAARECQEEALADVEIGGLLLLASVPHAHQVHAFFRARLTKPEFGAGPESLEVKLVRPEEIPWDELAFQVVRRTLQAYLEDRPGGVFRMRVGDLVPGG